MNSSCVLRRTIALTLSHFQRPKSCRKFSTVLEKPFRLAVIGSGPAGFYSAYRVMTRMSDAIVDMYEQLPVPFGLVRFGVAPDHPEVKNCQDKFSEVALSPRFNFVGNVNVGHNVSLAELRDHYDSILFAYGASKDKELGIPGEHLQGVLSARAFVGWYNGLPEYANLNPNLRSGDCAVVIGQGNVALDVARVLLSGVDRLRTTDIADQALEALTYSTIKKVHVVGRRGPMQAAFTIKELRELIQLPGSYFHPIDSDLLPGTDTKLPRAARRISELLKKSSAEAAGEVMSEQSRSVSLDFLRGPLRFNEEDSHADALASITLAKNVYQGGTDKFSPSARVEATDETIQMSTSLAFKSIGYKSEPLLGMDDIGIEFDMRTGTIPNVNGRVLTNGKPQPGLYCAGWVKRGPTGVIASTMEDAFATAESIVSDWANKTSGRTGLDVLQAKLPEATNWQDWLRIDATEKKMGRARGKEREKLTSIDDMLAIAQH